MPSLKIPGYGLSADGPVVVGVDPGGAELLRVGGSARLGALRVVHTAQPLILENNAAAGVVSFLQLIRNGVTAGYVGVDASDNPTLNRGDGASALTVDRLTGAVVFGTDPGGTELLRVGGAARLSGPVTVQTGLAVRGANAYAGGAMDVAASGTIANNGTLDIGDTGSFGVAMICDSSGARVAFVSLHGGAHVTIIANAISGTWGTVQGAANNFNVYWDAGSSKYRIENRTGATTTFYVCRLGNFPTQ